jgi:D-alanyl-D-alanine carboxypeptidase
MPYVLSTAGWFMIGLGVLSLMLARKDEKKGCTMTLLAVMLLFFGAGCFGVVVLKYPEMLPARPDFSVLFETLPTTEATTTPTEPTVEPTTEATEPTIAPTTEPTEPLVPGWHYTEEGDTLYIDDDGSRHTGWLKLEGETFYFSDEGKMVRGEVQIGGKTYHFASRGQRILLINPWNTVPEDYQPDLVSLPGKYGYSGTKVDRSCYDALIKMLDDCAAQCGPALVVSGYRSFEQQTILFSRKVDRLVASGVSKEDARTKAATVVAYPGTSEHQLGLAMDIVDSALQVLEEEQEDMPVQKWLMEHSWKYGFVLRYPSDKTEVTGIIYEPWHYRYVGEEIAEELHAAGITLEEYLQNLTKT